MISIENHRSPTAFALMACSFAFLVTGCNFIGNQTFAERLDHDLAERATYRGEGRVECQMIAGKLWSCGVEADPGSGWSGTLHLRVVDKTGCWLARHVRYAVLIASPSQRDFAL